MSERAVVDMFVSCSTLWFRFAIRGVLGVLKSKSVRCILGQWALHALALDHEVDDFSAGPLLLIPSAPKQTLMSVEAFAGSLGGEQMLTDVEPASAALRSASAFFASGLLPL